MDEVRKHLLEVGEALLRTEDKNNPYYKDLEHQVFLVKLGIMCKDNLN